MIIMYVDINICDGLHVQESLPRRHGSLSFEESAVMPIRTTGTASAFDNSRVSLSIPV